MNFREGQRNIEKIPRNSRNCREARVEFDGFRVDIQAAHIRFRLESKEAEGSHLASSSPHIKAGQENRAAELACDHFTKTTESHQATFSFMGSGIPLQRF